MWLGQPPCAPRKGKGGQEKNTLKVRCHFCELHRWQLGFTLWQTGFRVSLGTALLLPCGRRQLPGVPAPPLVAVALSFDLPDVRNEKRLMSRREKLLDFLRLVVAVAAKLLPMLEMSSWDWLRQDSFSRYLRRNSSFDPLCRNPTARKTPIIPIL